MRTFREIAEAYRILNDTKTDDFIKKNWGNGKAKTYTFDKEGAIELSKVLSDIIVSKDGKYVHIPSVLESGVDFKVKKILKKYNMEDVDSAIYQYKLGRF